MRSNGAVNAPWAPSLSTLGVVNSIWSPSAWSARLATAESDPMWSPVLSTVAGTPPMRRPLITVDPSPAAFWPSVTSFAVLWMWSMVTRPPTSATLKSSLVAWLVPVGPFAVVMLCEVTEPSVPSPGAPKVAKPAVDSTRLLSACDVMVTPGSGGVNVYESSAGPPGANVSAFTGSLSAAALSLIACGNVVHWVGTPGRVIGSADEHSWPSCRRAEPRWPARSPGQNSDDRPWPSPLWRLAAVSGTVASNIG